MAENQLIGILCIIAGLFSLFCALKDYDWFMEHRKAKAMTKLLGRNGARYLYMLLGACIAAVGVVSFVAGLSG